MWPQRMRPGPSPTVSAPGSYWFRVPATVEDGCRFTSGPITSEKCGMPLGLAGDLCTEECKTPSGHNLMPKISMHRSGSVSILWIIAATLAIIAR